MFETNKKRIAAIIIAVILNVLLVFFVITSVLSAFSDAQEVSFSQNIENVRTLTNASANKVELELFHHMQELKHVSDYINHYNDTGMNTAEIYDYFKACYDTQTSRSDWSIWQLADSSMNSDAGSNSGFNAVSLSNPASGVFSYRSKSYPELAKIFGTAGEDTLGIIQCTNEFTDSSPSPAKVFALTTTIRIRQPESSEADNLNNYQYKTLMLLVKSDYINSLIASNNDIDTFSFFNFSNVVVDNSGNYVISNQYFQDTNFLDYIALYNPDFSDADVEYITGKLQEEDYTDVLYYKNNRGIDCAYTIVPVQNSNWHILSLVPLASFHNAYDFSSSFLAFAVPFVLLFVIDIGFIMAINHKLRLRTKEAQAANIAKSQFLSSMSHDIRTPMNAIIGMTVIANQNLEDTSPDMESLKDCIKTIEISGNHLLTLINDILDISKIESGKIALSNADFSIADTISRMLEILQPQIKEKNLVFETHIINVSHEFVQADELRLNQIYINILSNAIKYTNPGGKVVVDFIEEVLPGQPDAARFIYKVSDTGIGMDEEFQKTIFDRFSRAVDTRINRVQGTGLGMSITKQLVDLMHGAITVESKLNVGSTFTVSLDLPVSKTPVEAVSLHDLSILLIDKDITLLNTAKAALSKAGLLVESAASSREGTQLAFSRDGASNPFDIIMVDWKINDAGGADLVRSLRNKLVPDTKIVVMTAYSIADIEQEARQAGANSLISKPLFSSKLLHTLQELFTSDLSEIPDSDRLHFHLKVLVTEDNNVNWKVIEKILKRYDIYPERAENGQEALDKVKSNTEPFDLILMDVQMPVMNGYTATDKIRHLDDPLKASTPIYAMTADTFAEDVASCLRQGMNGHLSKPIEIEKLLTVLTDISKQKNS